jgi:DNA-binding MarR family transcriptional regulator
MVQSPQIAGPNAGAEGGATHAELLAHAAARMPVMLRIMKLVAKRVIAEHAPLMATLGEGQWRALHVLDDDGTLQVGELAERCGVADPTVSKMLRSLEHTGLIERRTDPENRRTVWVSLTAKGLSLVDEMQASFEQGLAQVLRELNSDQLRDLLRTMSHLEQLVTKPDGA